MTVGMPSKLFFLERAALAGLEEEDGFSFLKSPIFCYFLLSLLILLMMIAFNVHKDIVWGFIQRRGAFLFAVMLRYGHRRLAKLREDG